MLDNIFPNSFTLFAFYLFLIPQIAQNTAKIFQPFSRVFFTFLKVFRDFLRKFRIFSKTSRETRQSPEKKILCKFSQSYKDVQAKIKFYFRQRAIELQYQRPFSDCQNKSVQKVHDPPRLERPVYPTTNLFPFLHSTLSLHAIKRTHPEHRQWFLFQHTEVGKSRVYYLLVPH